MVCRTAHNPVQSERYRKSTENTNGLSLRASFSRLHWLHRCCHRRGQHHNSHGILCKYRHSCHCFSNVLVFLPRSRFAGMAITKTCERPIEASIKMPVKFPLSRFGIDTYMGEADVGYFSSVNPRTTFPIRSILFTKLISILLSLVVLGSSTTFNDLVGLTVAVPNSSYLIASGLLLYRRCTGGIWPCHWKLAGLSLMRQNLYSGSLR